MTPDRIVRASVLGMGCLWILSTQVLSCGGTPGESLRDTAGPPMSTMAGSGASTQSDSDAGSSTGATCREVEEGCSCADWGATVSCKSVLLDFGDYVTCTGTRECVRGVWGPCVPPHFVPR